MHPHLGGKAHRGGIRDCHRSSGFPDTGIGQLLPPPPLKLCVSTTWPNQGSSSKAESSIVSIHLLSPTCRGSASCIELVLVCIPIPGCQQVCERRALTFQGYSEERHAGKKREQRLHRRCWTPPITFPVPRVMHGMLKGSRCQTIYNENKRSIK